MSARARLRVERFLAAHPDDVWRIVAGGDRVERWFEWVEATDLRDPGEGGLRVIRMKDGTAFDEHITLNDARSLTYQYYAPRPPLPVEHVIGTKRIDRDGGRITWAVSFDVTAAAPRNIVEVMSHRYAAALATIDALAVKG